MIQVTTSHYLNSFKVSNSVLLLNDVVTIISVNDVLTVVIKYFTWVEQQGKTLSELNEQ